MMVFMTTRVKVNIRMSQQNATIHTSRHHRRVNCALQSEVKLVQIRNLCGSGLENVLMYRI